MAKKIIKAQMKQRIDTKANWESKNPVLLLGELGLVSDDLNRYKVGDGTTAWNALPFRGFDGILVQETGTSENAVMSQKAVTEELTKLTSEVEEINENLDNLPQGASMTPITYADIVTLRGNGGLVAGSFYRITDYITTTTQENTQSAGHPFDVIVLALSESKLSEQAWAIQSERDTDGYFANSKLSVWQIWYSLDNNTERFAWADKENGKGVIYYMKDEHNNECPYDFKNIMFKHPIDVVTYPDYYYTFTNLVDAVVSDKTLIIGYCYGNIIKQFVPYSDKKATLNNIVFINTEKNSACYTNVFSDSCYNNSFGNDCYNNTFGNGCFDNSFGEYCFSNTFGNDCYNNSFGGFCNNNTFGNDCYNNSFGNECFSNTFGNGCNENTFGEGCQNNTFGESCYNNSFGEGYCWSNSFGNACNENTFGMGCFYNAFGNRCVSNTFGEGCQNNTFGNSCRGNSFCGATSEDKGHYYQSNHLGDGVINCTLLNGETAASNHCVQNYDFAQGLQDQIIEVTRNLAYETKVALTTSGELKKFNLADLA